MRRARSWFGSSAILTDGSGRSPLGSFSDGSALIEPRAYQRGNQ
jgi:hypothetical protein